MKRTLWLAYWSAALAALILAGCGNGTKKTDTPSKDGSQASKAPSGPSPLAVTPGGPSAAGPGKAAAPGVTPPAGAPVGTAAAPPKGTKWPLRLVYNKGESHEYSLDVSESGASGSGPLQKGPPLKVAVTTVVKDLKNGVATVETTMKIPEINLPNGQTMQPQTKRETSSVDNMGHSKSGAQGVDVIQFTSKPVGVGDSWTVDTPNLLRSSPQLAAIGAALPAKFPVKYTVTGATRAGGKDMVMIRATFSVSGKTAGPQSANVTAKSDFTAVVDAATGQTMSASGTDLDITKTLTQSPPSGANGKAAPPGKQRLVVATTAKRIK